MSSDFAVQERRRQTRVWVAVITVAAVVAAVGWAAWGGARSAVYEIIASVRGAVCTATSGGGEVVLTAEQMGNAATIAAVGLTRRLLPQGVKIALATAMQESGLRNLAHGDRDSLGLFQQRPSAGWGSPEEVRDPVTSSGAFYDELVKVGDYASMPLTDAAQAVQRSAYPEAYAKHEGDAAVLTAVLSGQQPAGLTCAARQTSGGGADAGQRTTIKQALERELMVTPREIGAGALEVRGGGWRVAHWAVAKAATLGIGSVSVGGRSWGVEGWRAADPGGTAPTTVRISAAS